MKPRQLLFHVTKPFIRAILGTNILVVFIFYCHDVNSTGYLTFVFVQAADHLDDEDDLEDEETALENFTTAVDNEETDEYIAFWTSMQG